VDGVGQLNRDGAGVGQERRTGGHVAVKGEGFCCGAGLGGRICIGIGGAADYIVALSVLAIQVALFDQMQYVLVDSADGGASNAGGYFFEGGAPLLSLCEMLHKLKDFLLASGEVCVYHFSTIEKKSKIVNFFRFFCNSQKHAAPNANSLMLREVF
jgi:hypothetical protein